VFAQRLVMTLLGVAVLIGLGLFARRVYGRRVALIATAIGAVYGAFWLNDALVMSETLAAGGVVALLLGVYSYLERASLRTAVVIGLVIGFAGLARAELLVLGGVVTTISMVVAPGPGIRRFDPQRVGHLAVAALVSIAVIAPWIIRNQIRFEETTLISTQDGLALLGTNCPAAYSGELKGFWAIECVALVDVPDGADQSQASDLYEEYGRTYLREHLDEVPSVVAARVGRGLSVWRVDQMTHINESEGRPRWGSWIATVQFWALIPLAAVGFRRWSVAAPRWPLVVSMGFVVVLMAALYGIPRFRVPGEVALVIAAAVGIGSLGARGDAVADADAS
jgi:4-amino-4-deoxy-L-arabinose transferase-like glycosyltransferase